jgi:hypothetical protein
MKEQEIQGVKWNCLFYQPEEEMLVQIYNNKTEEIIVERVVKNQEEYDFVFEAFTIIDVVLNTENDEDLPF